MTLNRRFSLSSAALALLLSIPGLSQAASPVAVTLSSESAAASGSQAVYVTVTFTNISSRSVRLLKWLTPADGIKEALFSIKRDGQDVPYRGAHYRRVEPRPQDYITLQPGQRFSRRVELSSAYNLQITGNYTVNYDVEATKLLGYGADDAAFKSFAHTADSVNSNTVGLSIAGRAPSWQDSLGIVEEVRSLSASAQVAAGVSYASCSTTQQTKAAPGFAWGQALSGNGLAYLNSTNNGPIFTRWFGTGSQSTVTQIMTRMKDAFYNKPVTIDCSCNESGTYAYVYPDRPYRIYVCGEFWRQQPKGDNSMGGTLVHEMSHFNTVGSTEDYTYGVTPTLNLARTSPSRAVANAESYIFFAEETPDVSGGGGGDTNKTPTAAFRASVSGLTVSFTDSSSDSDGSIAKRAWNFGDGSSSSSVNPSKTYAAAGSYSVTLTVTDDKGATAVSKQTVTVTSSGGGGGDTTPGGATTVNGSLSGRGASNIHPGSNDAPKSWFQTTTSTTLSAKLTGPATGADFELFLERWNGSAWTTAAKSTSSSSNESITYKAAAGYYRYKVSSYSGSGSYTLVFGTGTLETTPPPPPPKRG